MPSPSTTKKLKNITNEKKVTRAKRAKLKKKKKAEPMSPCDKYMETMEAFMDDNNFIGTMLIKGLGTKNDSGDEEKAPDLSTLTHEEMKALRYVMITQNRADKLEEMRKIIFKEQADSVSASLFDIKFSCVINDSLDGLCSLLAKSKTDADKFDILFSYTYHVKQYSLMWLNEKEASMHDFTESLAEVWKALLENNSNEELGLDTEYTKPGIVEMLRRFKEEIETTNSTSPSLTFKFE